MPLRRARLPTRPVLSPSCPPPAVVREVLGNVQRLTFYGFLVALSKHQGTNQALGKPAPAAASLLWPHGAEPAVWSWPLLAEWACEDQAPPSLPRALGLGSGTREAGMCRTQDGAPLGLSRPLGRDSPPCPPAPPHGTPSSVWGHGLANRAIYAGALEIIYQTALDRL